MSVGFEAAGNTFVLPDRQATLLAENLRLFSAGKFPKDVEEVVRLGASPGWRDGARAVADLIEEALVGTLLEPLPLEGKAAEATCELAQADLLLAPDSNARPSARSALPGRSGAPG